MPLGGPAAFPRAPACLQGQIEDDSFHPEKAWAPSVFLSVMAHSGPCGSYQQWG